MPRRPRRKSKALEAIQKVAEEEGKSVFEQVMENAEAHIVLSKVGPGSKVRRPPSVVRAETIRASGRWRMDHGDYHNKAYIPGAAKEKPPHELAGAMGEGGLHEKEQEVARPMNGKDGEEASALAECRRRLFAGPKRTDYDAWGDLPKWKKEEGRREKYMNGNSRNRRKKIWVSLSPVEMEVIDYLMTGVPKTKALKMAGHPGAADRYQVSRFFSDPRVKQEIEARQAEIRDQSRDLSQMVIEELKKMAFANIGDVVEMAPDDRTLRFNFEGVSRNTLAGISDVSIGSRGDMKVSFSKKKAALDSLSRILGLYQDRVDVTVNGEGLEERLRMGRAQAKIIDHDEREGS